MVDEEHRVERLTAPHQQLSWENPLSMKRKRKRKQVKHVQFVSGLSAEPEDLAARFRFWPYQIAHHDTSKTWYSLNGQIFRFKLTEDLAYEL